MKKISLTIFILFLFTSTASAWDLPSIGDIFSGIKTQSVPPKFTYVEMIRGHVEDGTMKVFYQGDDIIIRHYNAGDSGDKVATYKLVYPANTENLTLPDKTYFMPMFNTIDNAELTSDAVELNKSSIAKLKAKPDANKGVLASLRKFHLYDFFDTIDPSPGYIAKSSKDTVPEARIQIQPAAKLSVSDRFWSGYRALHAKVKAAYRNSGSFEVPSGR